MSDTLIDVETSMRILNIDGSNHWISTLNLAHANTLRVYDALRELYPGNDEQFDQLEQQVDEAMQTMAPYFTYGASRPSLDPITLADDRPVHGFDTTGMPYDFRYRSSEYGGSFMHVTLHEADFARFVSIVESRLSRFSNPRLTVLAEDGSCLVDNEFMLEAESQLKRRAERQKLQKYRDQLVGFQTQARDLEQTGRNVEELYRLIREFDSVTDHGAFYFARRGRKSRFEACVQLSNAIEKELERLSGNAEQLLINDLLNGSIQHPCLDANQAVLYEVEVWSIRSGGFVPSVSDGMLHDFYVTRLAGKTSHRDILWDDLMMDLADWDVDPEMYEDAARNGELVLAPTTIQLADRRGKPVDYDVAYAHAKLGNEECTVGIVQMPLSTFLRHRPAHGKPSPLPRLPHGIRWMIEVIEQNRVVARGEYGESLDRKVRKIGSAKSRNQPASMIDEIDIMLSRRRVQGTHTPWFMATENN